MRQRKWFRKAWTIVSVLIIVSFILLTFVTPFSL